MTLEDLEEAGLILPEDQWGTHALKTRVNRPLLLTLGAVTLVSLLVMYFDDGGMWTWISLAAYIAMLAAFTWLSWRAVIDES